MYPHSLWQLKAFLTPFLNRSEATRWERLLKLKTRGLKQRLEAFQAIANQKYPQTFSQKMQEKYQLPKVKILYEKTN
jgi:hypothetical protein